MYPNDKDRKRKEQIEEIFGLYVLNPSRRDAGEKVVLKPSKTGKSMGIELNLYYDQRPSFTKSKTKCNAYQWLLLGRFGEGGGVRTLFDRFKDVNYADIHFYTVLSERTVQRDGTYVVKRKPRRFLMARVTRKRVKAINWKQLETKLATEGNACAVAGEKAVDRKWYGSYLGKR